MKKSRLAILLLALLALLSFYVFSRQVKRGFLKQADFNFTVVLQNHMPARLDGVWDAIALPVTPTPSVVVVGLLTIAAFVDWKKKSAQGGSALGGKIRLRALIIPLLFGSLIMGELYGKSVVHHPAPPFFMIKHPTTIFPQFYVNEQYSYPSGHTARAVFLGMVLFSLLAGPVKNWMKQKKKTLIVAGLIVSYIAVVALGRMYLGSHWLSDVIGGALLGLASGLAVAFIL